MFPNLIALDAARNMGTPSGLESDPTPGYRYQDVSPALLGKSVNQSLCYVMFEGLTLVCETLHLPV